LVGSAVFGIGFLFLAFNAYQSIKASPGFGVSFVVNVIRILLYGILGMFILVAPNEAVFAYSISCGIILILDVVYEWCMAFLKSVKK